MAATTLGALPALPPCALAAPAVLVVWRLVLVDLRMKLSGLDGDAGAELEREECGREVRGERTVGEGEALVEATVTTAMGLTEVAPAPPAATATEPCDRWEGCLMLP